jgi:hypothetical protein
MLGGFNMFKSVRLFIGIIICLVLVLFGGYNVMNGNISFAPNILEVHDCLFSLVLFLTLYYEVHRNTILVKGEEFEHDCFIWVHFWSHHFSIYDYFNEEKWQVLFGSESTVSLIESENKDETPYILIGLEEIKEPLKVKTTDGRVFPPVME